MFNPRFPHSLVVKRPKEVNGEVVFDNNGEPTYEAVTLSIVSTMDGEPCRNANGSFVVTTASSISYGYRTSGKNTQKGDVIVSDYMLATPMFTTELKDGDILVMTDYDKTFTCRFVKKTTFNMGTNIWVNEIRN